MNLMHHIWSPWRMKYIENESQGDECPFCLAFLKSDNYENLVVFRGKNTAVMLNRYPYTSGHLMILPILHLTGSCREAQEPAPTGRL